MTNKSKNPAFGSTLDDLLDEEGVRGQFEARALKEVITWQRREAQTLEEPTAMTHDQALDDELKALLAPRIAQALRGDFSGQTIETIFSEVLNEGSNPT
jgi:hypothetical protein